MKIDQKMNFMLKWVEVVIEGHFPGFVLNMASEKNEKDN